MAKPPTPASKPRSYIGKRFDPETGLIYLNARYDPAFGRFISPDDWDPGPPPTAPV
ncbi:RHS repeat-associated protein [Rhizobium sp. BK049]|uniref:RHS repeat-associated core domain-containing protein n=1 Tax=Rhizobium sp. BK049 TaxID=2587095 RepID=UPI001622319B|nr:RHS repeat-associated core domain-containing protein [Rhizobium sp. BK049]MBB3352348.1 RHS repeat-associated protein [Rhizobium sp. BK049]